MGWLLRGFSFAQAPSHLTIPVSRLSTWHSRSQAVSPCQILVEDHGPHAPICVSLQLKLQCSDIAFCTDPILSTAFRLPARDPATAQIALQCFCTISNSMSFGKPEAGIIYTLTVRPIQLLSARHTRQR